MSDLFRPEALGRIRRRLDGDVSLAVPLPTAVLGLLFSTVAIVAFLFAATASYSRKETVGGWITLRGGLVRVSARQAGVASDIAPLGPVIPGEVIVTAVASTETNGGTTSDLISSDLAAEADAGNRELAAQLGALESEAERLSNSLEIGRRELTALDRRLEIMGQQLQLDQSVVQQSRSLVERGYLPQRELDARIGAALRSEEGVIQLQGQRLALERQANEARARLRAIPAERNAITARAEAVRAQLDQRATGIAAEGRFVVTAPIEGEVQEITVRRGQFFSAGDTVAVLAPSRSELEVELFIPAKAIGFVRPGQEVQLMLDAFPYQKFGSRRGSIVSVSAVALTPSELGSVTAPIREAVYRARVKLDRANIRAYGTSVALRPGMTLTADIIIERRTLLEWLLDPLYATGKRA